MASVVLTLVGDDRPGLVAALAEAVAAEGGSWERSELVHLAGRFAGVVLVTLPDASERPLLERLEALGASGLLDVRATPGAPARAEGGRARYVVELLGGDRPGIVREIAQALAARGASIDELATWTREAPMAGGLLFEARAVVVAPLDLPETELRAALESLADELMVDLSLGEG